ncbi:MAG TPA: OFA family MFS transporter [Firmicutes bacterium]|nr:OFA family MFS transporter [Bacillota bacterium]
MYQGWKVTIVCASITFLSGITYSWSIFASGLVCELGWTQTQAAFPYTVFIFCYALLMVATGRMYDRMGPRLVISIGGIFIGLSFILSSFLLAPYSLAITWGLLVGIGVACCYASVTPAAIIWFPMQKKGLVTGIVVFGMGLSAVVMAPVVNMLVEQSLKKAFLFVGITVLIGIFLLAQLVKDPHQLPSSQIAASRTGNNEKHLTQILHYPQFYLLWFMFCFSTGVGITFVTHLTRIVEVQTGFEKGYIMVALFAFFNAIGRLVAGWLSDRIGRNKAITLVFGIKTLVLLYILFVQTPAIMGLTLSILALTYGGLYSLFPAVTVSYFGDKNFGFNFGLVFTGLAAAGVFPLIAGHLFELQGDFHSTFILLLMISAVAMFLSFLCKKPATMLKETQNLTE